MPPLFRSGTKMLPRAGELPESAFYTIGNILAQTARQSSTGGSMSDRVAHLAEDDHPTRTLCGSPWEAWQDPEYADIRAEPTHPLMTMREKAESRAYVRNHLQASPGDLVRQCPACFKIVMRGGFAPS